MKIKAEKKKYSIAIEEYNKNKKKHKKPIRPSLLFRTLLKLVSLPDLIATHFKCEKIGMERLGKKEPAFFLMNHSSFIDLEIVSSALYPRPFNIVATTDGFIGKDWLMRKIGCIPTKKFVADATMVRDILHAAKKLKDSIVMYPEASYSFDGTATTLPDNLGKCVKMFGLPLCIITTQGAFSRDPLYNNLQRRKVNVSATVEYVLSPDEIASMSEDEIFNIIKEKFSFDGFRWQKENKVRISESFRADGLERILYKCPDCETEGEMVGSGIEIECKHCGAKHELNEYGELISITADESFPHVPDWYKWERDEVKKEITNGTYLLDTDVNIWISLDTKTLYDVGDGRLIHDKDGFRLTSRDGEINHVQKPLTTYSLYSDFNWYEVGDVICIGTAECLYYCFPKDKKIPVAKARLAAEELYKIAKQNAPGRRTSSDI